MFGMMRFSRLSTVACLAPWLGLISAYGNGNSGLRERAAAPSPISVPPSHQYTGNDGPWSTFSLQVGTTPQNLQVLVSTAAWQTFVVIPIGCSNVASQLCPGSRGGIYQPTSSSTWQPKLNATIPIEENLGYSGAATYGNETIGLGSGGPTLSNQVLGGIGAADIWVGMFGVNPQPSNFTGQEQPSYMSSLKNQNLIPSLSVGYTAGNQYRSQQSYGSLTLGGYDQAKFTPNELSIPFASDPSRDLVVGIQSITTDGGNTTSLLPSGVLALVDSTVPEIWLPVAACKQFEKAFGLVYDTTNKIYSISDAQHSALKALNPNITFTIGSAVSGGPTVDIVLPYAAFDLQASYPFFGDNPNANPISYFPLQQAADDTQYTIGRTLLQEAYLIVDWERSNFSLSQAIWPATPSTNIVPIASINSTSTSPGSPAASTSPSSSNGKTIGIAVGVTIPVVLLLLLLAFILFRRHRRNHPKHQPESEPEPETQFVDHPPPYTSPPSTSRRVSQTNRAAGKAELTTAGERYEIGSSNTSPPPQEMSSPERPDLARNTSFPFPTELHASDGPAPAELATSSSPTAPRVEMGIGTVKRKEGRNAGGPAGVSASELVGEGPSGEFLDPEPTSGPMSEGPSPLSEPERKE